MICFLQYSLVVLLLAPSAVAEDTAGVHALAKADTTSVPEMMPVAFTAFEQIAERRPDRWKAKIEEALPDTTALGEARERLLEAVRARDVQGLVDAFASDGVMRLRNGTLLHGEEDLHVFWTERWSGAAGPNPLGEWPDEIVFSGDFALERGGYGPLEAGPTGDYVRVWHWDSEKGWLVWWISLK